jgi:sugar lactone lactonase YvrE
MLVIGLLVAGMATATGATARASDSAELALPGAFFPESITAAPDGALFVSSIVSGEIVRFAPGSSEPTTFVADDVNVGTAGVMVDAKRGVLWACAIDLSFKTESALRAFDLQTGERVASYTMPDGGVCADIALVGDDLYVTDTLGGRIVRLTGTAAGSASDGTLEVWADSDRFRHGAFLQINGIAFDGDRTLYTTNYSTGELFAVRIKRDGSPGNPVPVELDAQLTNPDGIRWRDGYLYVADNTQGLLRVNPRTGTVTVLDSSLDQPTSLVFVGREVWITEGQVLRLQAHQDPNLPFKVVGLHLCGL